MAAYLTPISTLKSGGFPMVIPNGIQLSYITISDCQGLTICIRDLPDRTQICKNHYHLEQGLLNHH
jgi:hypothetical protein